MRFWPRLNPVKHKAPSHHNNAERWNELGAYNSRVHQGIVHEGWYVRMMADEQAAFDLEMEAIRAGDALIREVRDGK